MNRPASSLSLSLLFLAAAFAGCLDGSSGNGPSTNQTSTPNSDCAHDTCLADRNSRNYEVPFERYGLHQINDDQRSETQLSIDGELIAWASPWFYDGKQANSVFAYDLSSSNLIPVATGSNYHRTLPEASDGRVLYSQLPMVGSPDSGLPTYLMLWDSRTGTAAKLETGLGGQSIPYGGFDGRWAVFRQQGSEDESENALWAYEVDEGRLVKVFPIPPYEEYNAARASGLVDEAIHNGTVAFITSRRGNESTVMALSQIGLYDTTSGSDSLLPYSTWGTIIGIAVSDRYVAWEDLPAGSRNGQDYVIKAYDRFNQTVWTASKPGDMQASHPSLGGEWLTYDSFAGLRAVHLPTGRSFMVVPRSEEFGAQLSATDGERVVIGAFRLRKAPFDSTGDDLYWRDMPDWRTLPDSSAS